MLLLLVLAVVAVADEFTVDHEDDDDDVVILSKFNNMNRCHFSHSILWQQKGSAANGTIGATTTITHTAVDYIIQYYFEVWDLIL